MSDAGWEKVRIGVVATLACGLTSTAVFSLLSGHGADVWAPIGCAGFLVRCLV